MKIKLCIFMVGILFVLSSYSQEIDYDEQITSIFQNINKNRVSTGLLYDYGLQIIDPIYYDGVLLADSNYVDIDIWKSLYWGIYSSKVNNTISLTSPDLLSSNIEAANANSLAIMHIKYDKFKDNSITSGLLTVQNNQLYDVAGQNPYEQKMLFAIAPKNLYFESKTVSFTFNSNLYINNTGKTIRYLQINFNNENGYKTGNWNTAISHTFSSSGIKDIYFRIIYTDNSTYTVRTKIAVAEETPPELRASAEITIESTSNHSGGKIQIRYAFDNNSGKIRKPLIIAEGFDPGPLIGREGMDISTLSSYNSNNQMSQLTVGAPDIWNKIQSENYDIVYLDYNDGVDDIRRNARLFQEVIEYVNANKERGHPNVVLGISMGGLVARYALRKMEIEDKEHDTWKFITMDSPHKGANVPIGYQALLRHAESIEISVLFIPIWKATNIDFVKWGKQLLDSKAARQMLIYYLSTNYTIDNSEHTSFQTEYDNLGFPQQCENIAIANGAGNGTQYFSAGTNLMDIKETYKINYFLDLIGMMFGPAFLLTNFPEFILLSVPGSTQVVGTVKINALPNRTTAQVYRGKIWIKKKILWVANATKTINEKSFNSNSSLYPLDGASGGLYPIDLMLNANILSQYLEKDRFTFVPTVSALALPSWQTMLTYPLSNYTIYPITTPFLRNYMPTENTVHTDFESSAPFICSEISAVPSPLNITNTINISSERKYNRDIIVKSGGVLNISALFDASGKSITVESGGKIILNTNGQLKSNSIDIHLGGVFENSLDSMITIE